jgi:hypothetical protein
MDASTLYLVMGLLIVVLLGLGNYQLMKIEKHLRK